MPDVNYRLVKVDSRLLQQQIIDLSTAQDYLNNLVTFDAKEKLRIRKWVKSIEGLLNLLASRQRV